MEMLHAVNVVDEGSNPSLGALMRMGQCPTGAHNPSPLRATRRSAIQASEAEQAKASAFQADIQWVRVPSLALGVVAEWQGAGPANQYLLVRFQPIPFLSGHRVVLRLKLFWVASVTLYFYERQETTIQRNG